MNETTDWSLEGETRQENEEWSDSEVAAADGYVTGYADFKSNYATQYTAAVGSEK